MDLYITGTLRGIGGGGVGGLNKELMRPILYLPPPYPPKGLYEYNFCRYCQSAPPQTPNSGPAYEPHLKSRQSRLEVWAPSMGP